MSRIPWTFLALLPVLIKSFFVPLFSADQANPRPQTDSNSRMHNETLVFRVNSKFLYYIRDFITGVALFEQAVSKSINKSLINVASTFAESILKHHWKRGGRVRLKVHCVTGRHKTMVLHVSGNLVFQVLFFARKKSPS